MAFLIIYIIAAIATVFVWNQYVTFKWKTDWTLLKEDEVFDAGFYLFGAFAFILWPAVLPVILIFWAIESLD